MKTFIHEQLPALEVCRLEGTYLAWVDIHRTGLTADEACKKLLHEAKLMLNSGTMYGEKQGGHYLRINLACPKTTLVEGLHRLKKVLAVGMNNLKG